ncbi:MAG: tetratricopeptide repeat protein [Planctomycetota bacterium]
MGKVSAPATEGPRQDDAEQESAERAAARLNRFRSYLDRAPYHERIFDGLLNAARDDGGVASLLRHYAARVALDPDDQAGWVLLARLHAHERRWREAARALRHVDPPSARSLWLLGRMELDAGRLEEALIALERARLHATDDPELADKILEEHAQVMLLRGDLPGARRAYLDLAHRNRGDFARLMDTAALLAAANLLGDAVTILQEARELAKDDVARTCKVLAELGRLRERAHEGDQALACYTEAIALMARGHWLRRELLERSLALHRRAGTLLAAADEYRRILERDGADLDARTALVQALTLAGREREAAALLRQATELTPGDLALSARYAQALLLLGEHAAHTAELQRALEIAPGDRERRFVLGRTLAEGGDLQGAAREWSRLFPAGTRDAALPDARDAAPRHAPALGDRVAREWEKLGEPQRAMTLYAAGIQAEPRTVRRYGDLARLFAANGERERARQLLGRAEVQVAGRENALDELAGLYHELGDLESARRTLEAAHAAGPARLERLGRLARLHLELGQRDRALEVLRRWIDRSSGSAADRHPRALALEQYAELFRGAAREREVARLTSELAQDSRQPGTYVRLAYLHRLERSPEAACVVLARLLEHWPEDVAARLDLAQLLERAGRTDAALEQLERLVSIDPVRAADYLLRQSTLLAARGRGDLALESLGRVRATRPRDPATWIELARRYERLADAGRAAECLDRAILLDPSDGAIHMARARLAAVLGQPQRARDGYLEAWRKGQPATRQRALRALHQLLEESADLDRELRTLRLRRRRNPYDTETPRMLAELLLLEDQPRNAVAVLDDLLRRETDAADLLRLRARAYVQSRRHSSSLRDLRRLLALGQDVDDLLEDFVAQHLQRGDVGQALEVGYLCSDPLGVGQLFLSRARQRSGLDFLRRYARRKHGPSGAVLLLMADLHVALDEDRSAIKVLLEHESQEGPRWETSARLGVLYHALGERRRALQCGQRMLELHAPPGEVERYFEKQGNREALTELRCRRVLESATDPQAVELGLEALLADRYDAPAALGLLRKLRNRAATHGLFPSDTELVDWNRTLDDWVLRFYERNARLVRPRLDELLRRSFAISSAEWVELLWLDHLQGSEQPSILRHSARSRNPTSPAERAIQRFPGSARVLHAAARWSEEEGALALARGLYGRLAEVLTAEYDVGRERERLARSAADHARAVLTGSPPHPGLALGSPLLERLARLTEPPLDQGQGLPRTVCTRATALARHARLLARAGRRDAARACLAQLPDLPDEALLRWIDRASVHLDANLASEAGAILVRVARTRERLAREPELLAFEEWRADVDAALRDVAARYALARVLRRG